MTAARCTVAALCSLPLLLPSAACCAAPGERFLLYRVERVPAGAAPTIDGRLDEPVWQGKAALVSMRNFLGPLVGELATQKSEAVLVSDGTTLFIGATFFDNEMKSVLCNPANAPFWNDCIEIYFDPRHDGSRHIQLVVDCTGQRMWQKRYDDGYGWWEDPSWWLLAKWAAAVVQAPDRWTVEIALDGAAFGIDPTPGRVCGFNLCRFRLGAKPQEFSAWGYGPVERQKDMRAWGHLLFGGPGQRLAGLPVTRADVQTVYPTLAGRTVEVAVEGGMISFSAADEQRRTFQGILAPLLEEATDTLGQAATVLDRLPPMHPQTARLRQDEEDLGRTVESIRRDAADPALTLGLHDRLVDRLAKAREKGHDLVWKARLVELVAAVTKQ